jgi:hypothetical protein
VTALVEERLSSFAATLCARLRESRRDFDSVLNPDDSLPITT